MLENLKEKKLKNLRIKNINKDWQIREDGILFYKDEIRTNKYISNSGYYFCNICRKNYYIHRLVAESFIPNINNSREVNHKNGIKTDNRVENLEWVSSKENKEHAKQNGLYNKTYGEFNKNSKLKKEQVIYIRQNYKQGDSEYGVNGLSRRLKVSPSLISQIVNYKIWNNT